MSRFAAPSARGKNSPLYLHRQINKHKNVNKHKNKQINNQAFKYVRERNIVVHSGALEAETNTIVIKRVFIIVVTMREIRMLSST
jgi:hypothetical protein